MPLRPIHPPSTRRSLGLIQVWRDDLAEIVEVMRRVAPDLHLEIDNYELDDVDDLAELEEETINSFTATSRRSRIQLRLSRDGAFIDAEDPDMDIRHMIHAVVHLSQRRRRWVSYQPIRAAPAISMFLSLIAVAVTLTTEYLQTAGVWTFLIACMVLSATSFAAVKYSCSRTAVMSTRLFSAKAPWLVRNRDNLVANLLVATASLLIGFVVPK